jgi:hypothetical protein
MVTVRSSIEYRDNAMPAPRQLRIAPITTRALALFSMILCAGHAVAEQDASDTLAAVLRRLDALEAQNRGFAEQIRALERRNSELQAALRADPSPAKPAAEPSAMTPAPGAPAAQAATAQAPAVQVTTALASGTSAAMAPYAATSPTRAASLDWLSRVRVAGDFRFRHESIDDEPSPEDRTRETIRARIAAALQFTDTIDGEIGISTGGSDPRGGSATLGAASSRKPLGLDVGYVRWRPRNDIAVIGGKMRQPFVRPGLSLFVDNEIRPEGIAVTYDGASGVFGSAFDYWLEERSASGDSKLVGAQLGWAGGTDAFKLKVGAGYYDYGHIKGESPEFADGLVNAFGNTVLGSGDGAVYAFDYDIGQLFADAVFEVAGIPLDAFVDYAHNFEADNDLGDAYNVGVLFGKANAPGRWEVGVLRQQVEKDALFGHWADSDFAGGVTDNSGQLYRVAWMPLARVVLNVTYLDTAYHVDVGEESDYDRWQLDFNFTF